MAIQIPHTRRTITSHKQDVEHEKELQKQKLEANPEEVTSTSSVRAIVEQSPAAEVADQKGAVQGGLVHDLNIIKETFAFREVPREVLLLGGAGLIPYVATTASTLFLAWDVKNIQEAGTGYVLNEQTATALLEFLEPVQVGYGAVILSFLGAIHWGLEFAKFGGVTPYRRYFLGVFAPAVAWPTVFMPYDFALLAQFLGFTTMYFADAKITNLGFAPKWYTSYRFMLTFIVGASIVMTLIGRGKIGDKANITQTPSQRVSDTRQGRNHASGVEPERSSKEYNRLIKQEQEEIRQRAEEEKRRTEEELKTKEEEYKQAKKAAERAAQKFGTKRDAKKTETKQDAENPDSKQDDDESDAKPDDNKPEAKPDTENPDAKQDNENTGTKQNDENPDKKQDDENPDAKQDDTKTDEKSDDENPDEKQDDKNPDEKSDDTKSDKKQDDENPGKKQDA